jgi:excisionase family DNA binding protein
MAVSSDASSSLPEPFVNAREASKFVQLHPVTVQRLAREGLLPGHPVSNGSRRHWRFRLSELGRWLQERESGKNQ